MRALESIREDGVNVAVWRRALPAGVARELDECASAWGEPYGGPADASEQSVRLLLRGAPERAARARSFLQRELASLAERFAALCGAGRFHASFGSLADDKCRKFHVDYYALRLLVTYAGPGTEWVPDFAVRRSVLVHPPESPEEANALIVRRPRSIRRAAPGDVLVLKGEGWPQNAGRGAVHRSPPIRALGLPRLVLVLTYPEAPGESGVAGRSEEAESNTTENASPAH